MVHSSHAITWYKYPSRVQPRLLHSQYVLQTKRRRAHRNTHKRMNTKLLLCLACCLVLVLPSDGYSDRRTALNRFFENLMRDEEKPPCMSWSDQQPHICAEKVKEDPWYCHDYGDQPFCRRTCSPCGPKEQKAPAPSGECEDKMGYCSYLMHLHNRNQCKEQPTFASMYCRRYCGLCQAPLGSVWKP